MVLGDRSEAIREFFLRDDAMASFVEQMQVGRSPWSSVIDHGGRLVVMPPDRDVAYVVQPFEDGYAAVTYADLALAFDPDAVPSREFDAPAVVDGTGSTPGEAFSELCRTIGVEFGPDPAP